MSIRNPEVPRFGVWSTSEQVRTWEDAVVVVKDGWAETNVKWRRQREEGKSKKEEGRGKSKDVFTIELNDQNGRVERKQIWEGNSKGEAKHVEACDGGIGGNGSKITKSTARVVEPKVQESSSSTKIPAVVVCEQETCEKRLAKKCEEENKEPSEAFDNSKAIVVYEGKEVIEVVKSLGMLNLKREADVYLEADEVKRRRKFSKDADQVKAVTIFTESLRKTKAKARRPVQRRSKATVKKGTNVDGAVTGMKDGEDKVAEGMGGWPQTAPMKV